MANNFKNTFKTINKEVTQSHQLRLPYLRQIKKFRNGRTIVSFFISFGSESPLSQNDADMIEEVLANTDNSSGVSLLLDAPGGDGLAAERIIQICRSHSGKDFEVIVPARAKSAATMVCLGADQIVMSPTSELGPIDPQVPYDFGYGLQWVAADHIVKTYDDLFNGAVNLTKGDIAPYLQQLSKFDAVFVKSLRTASDLSKSIAVSSLERGMMKGKTKADIEKKIEAFTNPAHTMSHGRGITAEQAEECGLKIENIKSSDELWGSVWGLYLRSKFMVDRTPHKKLIETVNDSYIG